MRSRQIIKVLIECFQSFQKLDYCSAFAYVGLFAILTLARLLQGQPRWIRIVTLCAAFHFFFSYIFGLITMPGIDYETHMTVNLTLGLLTLVGWLVGIPRIQKGKEQTSYRVMQITVVYIASIAVLEVYDFPAILWLFDAHSLWHAATVIVPLPMFSFAIKDCQNLYLIEKKQRNPDYRYAF